MLKVALDAGHGYDTAGKRSPDGEREWSFNNEVLRACEAKLKTYSEVAILRLDDPTGKVDIPLKSRTNKANEWKADVLMSIHHNANAGKWGNHTGVETYIYPQASQVARQLATMIQARITRAMGLRDRGVKTANFHMLRESRMQAVLTEGGFVDSTIDIKALKNKEKMVAQGEAIAVAIATYFKLKQKEGNQMSEKENATIVFGKEKIEGFIENGRTYVQVRELAKLLQLKIEWDQKNHTVTLKE